MGAGKDFQEGCMTFLIYLYISIYVRKLELRTDTVIVNSGATPHTTVGDSYSGKFHLTAPSFSCFFDSENVFLI